MYEQSFQRAVKLKFEYFN